MSRDDHIVIYKYTRIIRGQQRLVYVVLWKMGDIDGFSDSEFSLLVLDMPYTRYAKTAQRIAEEMDDKCNTEYGISIVDCYRHTVLASTESSFVSSTSLSSIFPPLPPPLPPVYPPLPPPLPRDYPAYTTVSTVDRATSIIVEAKWLMLFKIRELETALTACRLQLETIDVEL